MLVSRPRGRAPNGKVWNNKHGWIDGDQIKYSCNTANIFGQTIQKRKYLNQAFTIRTARPKHHFQSESTIKFSKDSMTTVQEPLPASQELSYRNNIIWQQAKDEASECANVYWVDTILDWHEGTSKANNKDLSDGESEIGDVEYVKCIKTAL